MAVKLALNSELVVGILNNLLTHIFIEL